MKYRVISYLETYPGVFNAPVDKIRYKLQKQGWFGIWWTINDSDYKDKLETQAAELNNNHLLNGKV